jgi:hypothetical protein
MTQPNHYNKSKKLQVFLCYSPESRQAVHDLYQNLQADDVGVWLDIEDLLPGQNWQLVIPQAMRQADLILFCLSRTTATQDGYIQKQLKLALDISAEKPEDKVFIIPIRLDEYAPIPAPLQKWQGVDLFSPNGYEKLHKTISAKAQQINNNSTKSAPTAQTKTSSPPKPTSTNNGTTFNGSVTFNGNQGFVFGGDNITITNNGKATE